MSDFHSQGIRWLFGVHILPRKAVLKGRGFKPSFFDNYSQILMKRARVQGFIILDYLPRWSEAISDLGQWLNQGKIKYALEVVEGLENAPKAILKLFDGNKKGKLVVKVSEEPI